ncbi:MAG: T9SS type A sorting domain-containing protein [Bacteroidales bacterium]|nr:T9SS type A sorting domain-containing protein [Bacteroidales bacterium]
MKLKFLFLFLLFSSVFMAFAQQQGIQKATDYGKLSAPVLVPSIAQQIKDGTFIGVDPNETPRMGQPKRSGANMTVPGKGLPLLGDPLVAAQKAAVNHPGKEPILVFDANTSSYTPSDPTGAVGPNHFIGGWNVGFRIFDKTGNPLTPAASLSTLFPGNTLGDPIVLYDAAADRFIITEFDQSPNGFNMAICQGSDPVNDGWYIYTTGLTSGQFPDYPKFSVWSDGYYITANISQTNRVFVAERDQMLIGEQPQFIGFPLTGIRTSGFYSPQVLNVSNSDLPAAGNATVVYMQDDAWSGVSEDHLKLWSIDVDWVTPSQSTISAATELVTTPFISVFDGGSFSNRPQPGGPDIDVLQATIMNQAQFHRYADHNSAVFNFVVDTDGTGGELAGVRWYELRQPADGEPWEIFQEGTYISPYNNKDAFGASMAMDADGNIGMGYTTVSNTERIGIYYTGRYAGDPLGQMTIDETLIGQSTSSNPSNRLADYNHLTVDPSDDKTFWHIAEYFKGGRKDVVGSFKIASDLISDVGVLTIDAPNNGVLTDAEPVTVTLMNYGEAGQRDFPVFFRVDEGEYIYEVFADTLPPATTAQYTFTATAAMGTVGQSYQLRAGTALGSDIERSNDTIVKSVTNLFTTDCGVSAVVSPVSGENLTATENIVVAITNFGIAEQSNFEASYVLNGNLITETVGTPVAMGQTIEYTFAQTGDFSVIGAYQLTSYTSIVDEANTSNDTTTVTIHKTNCQPQSNCAFGFGLYKVKVGTIDNVTACSPNGYGDFTDLVTDLERNLTHELEVTTGYGNQYVRVWIDFNDNFVFEENELIVDNVIIAEGQGAGDYTQIVPFNIAADASLGEHLLRAKINYNALVPDDACEGTVSGETEDYKVNIGVYTNVGTQLMSKAELTVTNNGNNHFDVSLNSNELTETMIISLHDVYGQTLVENRIEKSNGRYTYPLDLSYAKPGVYIVRVGTHQYGKVKKIVVK